MFFICNFDLALLIMQYTCRASWPDVVGEDDCVFVSGCVGQGCPTRSPRGCFM